MEEKTTQVTIQTCAQFVCRICMHRQTPATSSMESLLTLLFRKVFISALLCLAMSGSSPLSTQTIDEAFEDDDATSV